MLLPGERSLATVRTKLANWSETQTGIAAAEAYHSEDNADKSPVSKRGTSLTSPSISLPQMERCLTLGMMIS